jgi:hypothetical protein
VLLLAPTKDATGVMVGSDDDELVQAAEADWPLGPIVEARTRLPEVARLAGLGGRR